MNSIPERARRFHRGHPIADLLALNLCHPRFTIADIDLGKRDETSCRGDFPKFRDWGLKVVMCKGGAAPPEMNFTPKWPEDPTFRPGRPDSEPMYLSLAINSPTLLCLAVLDRFLCNVEENPDKVILVRTVADLDRALRDPERIAVLMGANRSDWFGDSPGALRQFARLGLRMVTIGQSTRELGWDVSDELRSGGRMTALGVRMIEEMNRRGILIDLAHTNDPCALDAIEVSEKPVIDTHSGPRALEEDPSPRSTSDEVMKAMAENGGLLGIVPPIGRPYGDAPYESVDDTEMEETLKQIRYAVDLMGAAHVGIGTHFNSAVIPWITEALLEDGFSEEDTASIMGGNYLRVLREVLPA